MSEQELRLQSLNPPKAPTGIPGFDDITRGGLPAQRSTLVCGGPGCGKTIFGMEFLIHGAASYSEPGLFVSFDQSVQHLMDDARSIGIDVDRLVEDGRLKISHVLLEREELVEAGAFSLDGLFVRIGHDIKEMGVKRVVLDSMDTLFSVLSDSSLLRNEISRLLHWLQQQGVTSVVTSERGSENLTRFGFEEYISDCVVLLDHRVTEQISKRRLRIVKYRGSGHEADEQPFVITSTGISVLPITSASLDHPAPMERLTTGVTDLDDMLGAQGYLQGSTILASGKAGSGKSTLAIAFALAVCARKEKCLYFAFEESEAQLTRDMKSVGLDMQPMLEQGLLTVYAARPTTRGLEEHLLTINREIDLHSPSCIIVDPITNFISMGSAEEVKGMLFRVLDHAKAQSIAVFMTALTSGSGSPDETEANISSMVDIWLALDLRPTGHTRRRELYVVKARGIDHAYETRELVFSSSGISIRQLPKEER